MDVSAELLSAISLAMGAAWASGLNLYLTTLVIGGLGALGIVDLPPDLDVMTTPPVLLTAGALFALEFFADKIPGIDSLNDAVHTFIRIPAGAMLAYGSIAGVGEPWQAAAALVLGGLVTAGSHATKTGSRAIINMSPEPFSNWAASIFEDVLVLIGLMLALFQPVVFLFWMAAFALFLIWFLPKLWRGLKMIWARIQGMSNTDSGGGRGLAQAFTGDVDFHEPGQNSGGPVQRS